MKAEHPTRVGSAAGRKQHLGLRGERVGAGPSWAFWFGASLQHVSAAASRLSGQSGVDIVRFDDHGGIIEDGDDFEAPGCPSAEGILDASTRSAIEADSSAALGATQAAHP